MRVLEVGGFMAAPFAAMHLADLGAEATKVEDPNGGDPLRATGPFLDGYSSPFVRLNRNKRSVALDLRTTAGRDAFVAMADRADVLVQNLRPGAMDRLGLGADELCARNPRLVYVSASGWGTDGPLAGLAGLDIMAQARSGLMSNTGPEGGPPAKVGVPVCDLTCGLYAALGAVSALHHRDRTGEGQHVDISLFESGVSLSMWEAGRYFAAGEVAAPLGTAHHSLAPYQAVRAADGEITVGAVTPRTWAGLCSALDLPDLERDERYATAYSRFRHRDTLIPTIERVTTTRSTADLLAALERAGVPCAPVATADQVFTDEHLTARDYFWDAPHPDIGPVRQLGSAMRFSRTPTRRDHAGPSLGAHTRAALAELGWSDDDVDRMITTGAAAEPGRGGGGADEQ